MPRLLVHLLGGISVLVYGYVVGLMGVMDVVIVTAVVPISIAKAPSASGVSIHAAINELDGRLLLSAHIHISSHTQQIAATDSLSNSLIQLNRIQIPAFSLLGDHHFICAHLQGLLPSHSFLLGPRIHPQHSHNSLHILRANHWLLIPHASQQCPQ